MPERIFFWGDLHFRTPKVTLFRPEFTSFEEHDESIVERWNAVVGRNDRAYILGDLGAGGQDELRKLYDRLNGRLYVIEGNHDDTAMMTRCRGRFQWIKGVHDMTLDGVKLWMCHYALVTWPGMWHGSIMLHGHTHANLPDDPLLRRKDAGFDTRKDGPWPWEEIKAEMLARPIPTPADLGWDRPL